MWYIYTKTIIIIHLSVAESDGYLPPRQWMIVDSSLTGLAGTKELLLLFLKNSAWEAEMEQVVVEIRIYTPQHEKLIFHSSVFFNERST